MRNSLRQIIGITVATVLARPVLGQDKVSLQPYTNDTLGFSINLPEEPVWIPKDEKGAGGMLLCQQSKPMVMIAVKQASGERTLNSDDLIKREFQVGDTPLKVKKTKCSGYKARRVTFSAGGMNTLCLLVSREDRIYLFMLLQPVPPKTPWTLAFSIRSNSFDPSR